MGLLLTTYHVPNVFLLFLTCSETVKFGHVTFFWNGNRSGYFDPSMEEYVEIPSDMGISFNVQPKMKALEIAERARHAILSGKFHQLINIWTVKVFLFFLMIYFLQVCTNLANGDMEGHTGDIKAADEAVKVPIAIGGRGLAPGVRFRKDLPNAGLANVVATVINLPGDYEPTLIEVVRD
ncbi:hypothetical protein C4D60_Mb09t04430 [Musa balbisiana]|uniref:Metalloenzyme domain-containing protein n=1 Tax=Musa balbisiana TaxID=52838 RepID=A0A4S8IE14_MUSBA|nr:hypothetical protein C4D60_Mb09t04430 [Musa balbisiana]